MSRVNQPLPLILMVTAGNFMNGKIRTITFIQSQAESLEKFGVNVFLGFVDDRTSIQGILRNFQKLRAIIKNNAPGIVHAQYGSVIATLGALVKGPLPLVVSFCGDDLLGTPIPGLGWRIRVACSRLLGLWSAKRASVIIVKSRNLYEALPKKLRDKAYIVPNGVDVENFKPMERNDCRRSLNWPPDAKVVIFNCSDNSNQNVKNLSLAQDVIKWLSEKVPNLIFEIIGNASREEVAIRMNAADCLLVTSLHEGSPNIVKEAMACNLPVVSVLCGDVQERLKETKPGEVTSYDVNALGEAILRVFEAHSSSNGREHLITQGLSQNQVAQRLMDIYRTVLPTSSSLKVSSFTRPCVD